MTFSQVPLKRVRFIPFLPIGLPARKHSPGVHKRLQKLGASMTTGRVPSKSVATPPHPQQSGRKQSDWDCHLSSNKIKPIDFYGTGSWVYVGQNCLFNFRLASGSLKVKGLDISPFENLGLEILPGICCKPSTISC